MKLILILTAVAFLYSAAYSADESTVILKNGKSLRGEITEMNSEHVLLDMGGAMVTVDRGEIAAIDMTGNGSIKVPAQLVPIAPSQDLLSKPSALSLPANTILMVSFDKTLSSGSSKVGELFTGRLIGDVRSGQQIVFPAGTKIEGRVSSVSKARRGVRKSPGMLNLEVLRVIKGSQVVAVATALEQESGEATKGSLIGGAAGGAIFGEILNDDAGKGAAAGTAKGLMKKGDDITVTKGSVLAFSLRAPVTVQP